MSSRLFRLTRNRESSDRGLRLEQSGLYVYEARLEPLDPADDSLPQNNSAVGFTVVDVALPDGDA